MLFAFTLAIVAFTGLDASSGLAGQVAVGRKGLKRLIAVRVPSTVIPYVGIGLRGRQHAARRTAGCAPASRPTRRCSASCAAFEQAWLREPLTYLVAASAVVIMLIGPATRRCSGSRGIGYSLALNRQIPSTAGRLHPRYSTPVRGDRARHGRSPSRC